MTAPVTLLTPKQLRAKIPHGTKIKDAAKILGVARSTAHALMVRASIQRSGATWKVPAAVIVKALKTDMTIREIAQEHGLSTDRVMQIRAKLMPERMRERIQLIPHTKWTEAKKSEFASLWRQGIPKARMADHFGVSRNAISKQARRMGLDQRIGPEIRWKRAA